MTSPLTRLAFAAVALVALASVPLSRTRSLDAAGAPGHEAWLDALGGKHRQLFDSPDPNGGIPLVHILNFYETYNKAYGVADKNLNAVGTFYGATTFHGVNDAMWAKYRIGEFMKANDATGKPATANPWRAAPVALGMTLPQASIESLQKRGATFILCNNALTFFAGAIAKAQGLSAEVVYADLKANMLPGVSLVPGMIVAIEKAQERGVAYHRE